MQNQNSSMRQVNNFKCPPEEELFVAVEQAFEQAGGELFKAFLNDYKQSVEMLKLAA